MNKKHHNMDFCTNILKSLVYVSTWVAKEMQVLSHSRLFVLNLISLLNHTILARNIWRFDLITLKLLFLSTSVT